MEEKTFIELYEELSKLYESEELTEKDGLKKAAIAAGLLASGIGVGAGINQAIQNSKTQEIPISAPAQVETDDGEYLSYTSNKTDYEKDQEALSNLNLDIVRTVKLLKTNDPSGNQLRASEAAIINGIELIATKDKIELKVDFDACEAQYKKEHEYGAAPKTTHYGVDNLSGIFFNFYSECPRLVTSDKWYDTCKSYCSVVGCKVSGDRKSIIIDAPSADMLTWCIHPNMFQAITLVFRA